jgi:hypothetical protein
MGDSLAHPSLKGKGGGNRHSIPLPLMVASQGICFATKGLPPLPKGTKGSFAISCFAKQGTVTKGCFAGKQVLRAGEAT